MKINKISKKSSLGVLFAIFLLVLFFYLKSIQAFFQGDEWYYFKLILPHTKNWYGAFSFLYESTINAYDVSSGAHLTPISNLLYYFSVKFFTFNYWPYALSGIVIHSINSFLVFSLVNLLLPKNRKIAIIASIFFGISYVHQQAVVWTMTYLWTALSVTFFLLCLIYLLKAVNNKLNQSRDLTCSALFALFALLTKESTIILFPIVALILLFWKQNIDIKKAVKRFFVILVLYLPYRFLLPKFFAELDRLIGHESKQSEVILEYPLLLFRAFAYPLKALTEVFVPAEWIKFASETLTPLAYPNYSSDMKILGSIYVTFTQSAGSDMIIYIISMIILLITIFAIRMTRDKRKKYAIALGLFIIVLSSLPLLSVATYAPWWGYVTFIDSRHLYLTSVGGSILFALAIVYLSSLLSIYLKKINLHLSPTLLLLGLILFWAVCQYKLLDNQLQDYLITATQRKAILKKVFEVVPEEKDKKVIFIESNQGYYGFTAMPPFQTNLGQIFTILYYQKNMLPEFFINNDYIVKGGLQGEGYAEYTNKGFGYFINKKNLLDQVVKKEVKIEDIFSFYWDGEKDLIFDKTSDVRIELRNLLLAQQEVKDWRRYNDDATGVTFIYPPHISLVEQVVDNDTLSKIITLKGPQLSIRIEILLVPDGLGFYDVYKTYVDSDGNELKGIVVKSFELDSVHKNTVLMADTGSREKYFIPTHKEVVSFQIDEVQKENNRLISQLIGSIEVVAKK